MTASSGFAPLERCDARVLVLGSLPGDRSIAEQQYYAHPQNAFWKIMRELFAIDGDYAQRCGQLNDCGIALWDVLESSVRPGSMDADIRLDTARPNDFATFLARHPGIRLVAFNGRKAEQLFRRFVAADTVPPGIEFCTLPSTSPAYASMAFSGKLSAWGEALRGALVE